MREHKVEDEVEYVPTIVKALTILRAQTLFSKDGELHPFHQDPPLGVAISKLAFSGFQKCCFGAQKFDSFEGEFQFARRKTKAAVLWCRYASQVVASKPFSDLLIPHLGFGPQFAFETLKRQYVQRI